jgi:hypothetical protein
MNTAFVLGLALVVGVLLAPNPAPAFDPSRQGAMRAPVDPWARWPPRRHPHQFRGQGPEGRTFPNGPPTVIVGPSGVGMAPHHAWVPGQWAWTGLGWVWVPGHWVAIP